MCRAGRHNASLGAAIPPLNCRKIRAFPALSSRMTRYAHDAQTGESSMKRKLMLALFALPVLAVSLGGCIVYPAGGGGGYYGHPHYWHDRDRW